VELNEFLEDILSDVPGIKFILVTDERGDIKAVLTDPRYEELKNKASSLSVSSLAIYGALKVAGDDFQIGKPILLLSKYEEGILAIFSINKSENITFIIIAAEPTISLGLLNYIATKTLELVEGK